jgi:hypothetical protein
LIYLVALYACVTALGLLTAICSTKGVEIFGLLLLRLRVLVLRDAFGIFLLYSPVYSVIHVQM